MQNRLIWIVIGIIAAFLSSFFQDFNLTKPNSTDMSYENRLAILTYEKILVCDLFDPCWDASVDGAMGRNPRRSYEFCKNSIEGIDAFYPPKTLPPNIIKSLTKVKKTCQVLPLIMLKLHIK